LRLCFFHLLSRIRLSLNSFRPTPWASYQCTSAVHIVPSES
jgi:hypothetical protein